MTTSVTWTKALWAALRTYMAHKKPEVRLAADSKGRRLTTYYVERRIGV